MNKYLRVRLTPEQRQEQILQAAVKLANEGKLYNMSFVNIADEANCKRPTIKHYFKSLIKLRAAVIQEAISKEHYSIIAQAIAGHDDAIKDCPQSIKNAALEWCKND